MAAIGVKWKDLKSPHEVDSQIMTSEKHINSTQDLQMESSIGTETTETKLEVLNTENSECQQFRWKIFSGFQLVLI